MGIKCPKCHFENPDDTTYCGKCASALKPAENASVTKTLETPVEGLTRGMCVVKGFRQRQSIS